MKATIPSIITTIRIVVAPIIFFLLLSESSLQVLLGGIIFFIASYTDYVDGWLARRWNVQTKWGSFYDPFADKVLTLTTFYYLVCVNIMPFWMFVVITIRDVLITLLRWRMNNNERPFITSLAAKIKTFYQMIVLSIILIFIVLQKLFSNTVILNIEHTIPIQQIFSFLLLTVTAYSLWTGVEYLYKGFSWKK